MGIYAVQVQGGREVQTVARVTHLAPSAIKECFVPTRDLSKRVAGQWRTVREVLFPGYVFIDAADPEPANEWLRQFPAFARMLGSGGTFIPLSTEEQAWLGSLAEKDTHVVRMSQGIIEGDQVTVVEGPLRGHEALIKRIDRHKRLAYLELRMLGRRKTVRIGLEIVRKC